MSAARPGETPVLRGHYELSSIKEIDQWRSRRSPEPDSFKRLLYTTIVLFIKWFITSSHIYKTIASYISNLIGFPLFSWTELGLTLILSLNVGVVLWKYAYGNNEFDYLPLTPTQRRLLGLEPVISKAAGQVPKFKKPTIQPTISNRASIFGSFINQPQGALNKSRAGANAGSAAAGTKEAEVILNKSMSRSFNQSSVQDKTDLTRLMRNMEAIEEAQSEWKTGESDPSKRPFALHAGFGAQPTGDLSTGVSGSGMVGDVTARTDLARSLASGSSPVGRYYPALRTTLSKDQKSKTDLQKDGVYVVSQSKVMKNLKVTEAQLDRWAYNMRKWMWDHIVSVVVKEMEWVDAELAKEGLSYLDCKSANMFSPTGLEQTAPNGTAAPAPVTTPAPAVPSNPLGWGSSAGASARLPSAFTTTLAPVQPPPSQRPTTLKDLDARLGSVPFVKQRMVLETYLAIPGCTNRKYVVERITIMGPLLSHFIWDSNGIKWDNGRKSWTPDLPTDAQIVMHLFTVFMDLAMPSQSDQSFGRFPFSYKYYATMEAKPDSTTSLQIKQSSKVPPHYNLIVDGTLWEVVPKRLNVWYTLVMFIYLVMRESGGYIGQTNIGTQKLGLGDVVDGYDL
ncbi:hypothetical protein BG004_007688 [Podila humilis]|nr:hypothetical protein BG004_007688 [Podila humilis]